MPDFQDYHSEDFLQDDSFCRYCTGTDKKATAFWEGWIKAHPEKQPAVKEAKELYYILNGNITAKAFLQQRKRFEQSFNEHLQQSAVPVKKISPVWKALTRAAAIALLINMAGYSVYLYKKNNRPHDYSSLAGERKSFQLPDGTNVMLNANSHLLLSKNFNKDTREITLIGEAYFDVTPAPDKPFIVHTRQMDIRVLGTSFNVRAYPEDKSVETALIKGKVEVTLHDKQNRKVILLPAQKIILPVSPTNETAPATATIRKVDVITKDSSTIETSWTRNRLVLNNTPLGEAALEMSRWYGVKITVDPAIANKYSYTATFEKETVEQALKAMQSSVPFNYSIKHNEIFISQ